MHCYPAISDIMLSTRASMCTFYHKEVGRALCPHFQRRETLLMRKIKIPLQELEQKHRGVYWRDTTVITVVHKSTEHMVVHIARCNVHSFRRF